MMSYLITLNMMRFLTKEAHKQLEGKHVVQSVSAIEACMYSNYICQNYILKSLNDYLYNKQCKEKTTKDLG